MSGSLIDRVVAAQTAFHLKYATQIETGLPLSNSQNAELLIVQVQAIIAGDAAIDVAEDPAAPITGD